MKTIPPKDPRVKLDDESYMALHRQILQRDNWRCRPCGGMRTCMYITSRIEVIQEATSSPT